MTNKELFYFTEKCMMLDDDHGFRQEIIDKIAADLINWQDFIVICNAHLILTVIYLKFKSHDQIEYLPKNCLDF